MDESVESFIGRFLPLCWVLLVLVCHVVFESFFFFFVELSDGSVNRTRHLLGAILCLSVCLSFIVGRGGVRFPGKVGVLVHPRLR